MECDQKGFNNADKAYRKTACYHRKDPPADRDGGRYPIKRVLGEKLVVYADIFPNGYEPISSQLLYRKLNDLTWNAVPMSFVMNNRWNAEFVVTEIGQYTYTVEAWIDHFKSWQLDLKNKVDAKQEIQADLLIGISHLQAASKRAAYLDAQRLTELAKNLAMETDPGEAVTTALGDEVTCLMKKYPDPKSWTRYDQDLRVIVDRPKALFSAWYELSPRSCASRLGQQRTLIDYEEVLPEIARLGFDVLYLPPIYPIGKMNWKDKTNNLRPGHSDQGGPFTMGSEAEGLPAIHRIGTVEDLDRLIQKAEERGIEAAMDIAYQYTPDHPYVKERPEWFRWRQAGTDRLSENPSKGVGDILPFIRYEAGIPRSFAG